MNADMFFQAFVQACGILSFILCRKVLKNRRKVQAVGAVGFAELGKLQHAGAGFAGDPGGSGEAGSFDAKERSKDASLESEILIWPIPHEIAFFHECNHVFELTRGEAYTAVLAALAFNERIEQRVVLWPVHVIETNRVVNQRAGKIHDAEVRADDQYAFAATFGLIYVLLAINTHFTHMGHGVAPPGNGALYITGGVRNKAFVAYVISQIGDIPVFLQR